MRTQNSIFCYVVLFILLAIQSELNAQINSIKILESIEVDSVPADFPVSFSFLQEGEWQFIAYYNKNRNLSVASRKVVDDSWSYKVLPTKVGWDSHNRIAMTLDRDMCLHVTGNMHNDSMTYFISKKPFDISTFQKVFPLVLEEDELRCTYPNFLKTAEGQLIYSYRKGGSGNGITITNIYDEDSKSYRRLSDKPLFDGLNQMSAYASGPQLGPDGFYHLAWLWRDTPHCETNHDLSYARSKDLITWETMDGTEMESPITPRLIQFTVDPVPPGGGVINGAYRLFFDNEDNPMLAYMKYDEAGNNQIFVAKVDNRRWVIRQASDWNYRWEFKGPGSITFKIRINDVDVSGTGQIKIKYWHIESSDGELIVDASTLSLISDDKIAATQIPDYPEELMVPVRSEAGMTVQWLKAIPQSIASNETYVLRWETMGKRRFYEPPENPVKPSVLNLYKFKKKRTVSNRINH